MTDYYKISLDEMPLFDELGNKSILITGATGLIGSAIVNSFLSYNEHSPKKIHTILYVRNMRKALDLLTSGIFNTAILVIAGAFSYFMILLILRDEFFLSNAIGALKKMRAKLKN